MRAPEAEVEQSPPVIVQDRYVARLDFCSMYPAILMDHPVDAELAETLRALLQQRNQVKSDIRRHHAQLVEVADLEAQSIALKQRVILLCSPDHFRVHLEAKAREACLLVCDAVVEQHEVAVTREVGHVDCVRIVFDASDANHAASKAWAFEHTMNNALRAFLPSSRVCVERVRADA